MLYIWKYKTQPTQADNTLSGASHATQADNPLSCQLPAPYLLCFQSDITEN